MRKTLILALLLLAAALPLAAQSLTGTVTGTVKDDQGGVLPGVTVSLLGKTGSRSTTTDAQGVFRFAAVDPGTYSLTAELSSFRPKRQDNVEVSIGKVATIPMTLSVGGITEQIEVVGESPVVDVTSSETDNSLSQEMLFNLPIRPTNAATDLLNYLPGINSGSAFGGNEDYGSALLLDGVDTRDPDAGSAWTFFNFDLVDEVQVGGVGAPAEYGAYTGAIVNTITKSGGNRFTGLFDAYWTRNSFSSDNVSAADKEANPALADPAVINKRLDLTAQLGGPIIQDKLFFYFSTQRYQQIDNPSGPRTRHTEVSPRVNGKLTWQPTSNDNVSFNFQWDYYNQTGRSTIGTTIDTDQQTLQQDSPEAVWGVQWRHLFGPSTFSEIKYTGWWGYYYLDPVSSIPVDFDGTTSAYSGGGAWYYLADRGRNQVNASISHYAEAFGKHDLKFGLEVERSKVRSQYGYGNGFYYYDYTAYYPARQYLTYSYSYDIEGRNQRESLYAQDAWNPTERLTINAGVRVDFDRGRSPVLDKKVYSTTNWAPRIGFAYDLTGDGKTVLKGHYGQYYDGIYFFQYSAGVPGIEDSVGYFYDPAGDVCGPLGNCFTEFTRSPTPIATIDPDIKHPRVDEWTAGIERELAPDVRLSVTGIWRQDKNIQGAVYPDARWTRTTLTSADTGADATLNGIPVTAYQWVNQDESENNYLITNVDGFQYLAPDGSVLATANAERKYKGVMFVLDKRFSNRWQGRVSYVWSKSEGVIDNLNADTYGGAAWAPFWQTPTLSTVNTFGRTTNDRTHELKVYATWQVPKIDVGLNAYYRFLSGRTYAPYQRFSSSDINYPRSGGRAPYLVPRGSRRLDSESYLDLRLEKIFPVGEGTDRLSIYADVQNLFNAGTVIDVNGRHPSASVGVTQPDGSTEFVPIDVGTATALARPRRWLLGARWSF
jgi:hypothetical protein